MSGFERWIWYLNIAATCALLVRLGAAGLFRIYNALVIYLFTDTLQQALRLAYLSNGNRSAEIYMGGQAVKMILAVWVVLELYRMALAGRPALARFARNTVAFALAAAAILAAAGLILDPAIPTGASPILHRFYTVERTMDAAVSIFLMLISAFMVWFPVQVPRNAVLYIGGFVVFFLSRSAGLLVVNLLPPQFLRPVSSVLLSISFACLLMWLVVLRRHAEDETVMTGHRWNRPAADRLTGQLEAINASLLRLSRR